MHNESTTKSSNNVEHAVTRRNVTTIGWHSNNVEHAVAQRNVTTIGWNTTFIWSFVTIYEFFNTSKEPLNEVTIVTEVSSMSSNSNINYFIYTVFHCIGHRVC